MVKDGDFLVQKGIRFGYRDPRHARHHTRGRVSSLAMACQRRTASSHEYSMSAPLHNLDFCDSGRKIGFS
jgi:hypothetical protein